MKDLGGLTGSHPTGHARCAVDGASRFDPGRIALPANYSLLSPQERREARAEYARQQKGLCYHCKAPLSDDPPASITKLKIDWRRFPPNFLRWPHHLHHCHDTDMTIGVVHAYCNAVLWQYHGE